jgi:NADH-ubiquinone oxidoreductase chain 1
LLVPYLRGFISFELGLLFFSARTRLGVYTVMIAGWFSNSGYSVLSGLRALAQTISYEVKLAFILFSFVVLFCRYNLVCFYSFHIQQETVLNKRYMINCIFNKRHAIN